MNFEDTFERISKDLLFYGVAYIDPEKEEPLDPRETDIKNMDNWKVIEGFIKGTHIWIRKR